MASQRWHSPDTEPYNRCLNVNTHARDWMPRTMEPKMFHRMTLQIHAEAPFLHSPHQPVVELADMFGESDHRSLLRPEIRKRLEDRECGVN